MADRSECRCRAATAPAWPDCVDHVVDQVPADAAVVEQRVALGRRAVGRDLAPASFRPFSRLSSRRLAWRIASAKPL